MENREEVKEQDKKEAKAELADKLKEVFARTSADVKMLQSQIMMVLIISEVLDEKTKLRAEIFAEELEATFLNFVEDIAEFRKHARKAREKKNAETNDQVGFDSNGAALDRN